MLNEAYYIARNKNGNINLFFCEPRKNAYGEWLCNAENDGVLLSLDESDLPAGINPSWTDNKAIAVRLLMTEWK